MSESISTIRKPAKSLEKFSLNHLLMLKTAVDHEGEKSFRNFEIASCNIISIIFKACVLPIAMMEKYLNIIQSIMIMIKYFVVNFNEC